MEVVITGATSAVKLTVCEAGAAAVRQRRNVHRHGSFEASCRSASRASGRRQPRGPGFL